MTYDKENRMKAFFEDSVAHTFSYDGDGYKRTELQNGALSTLIWDGTDYFGRIR
jgi:hypothetical protein